MPLSFRNCKDVFVFRGLMGSQAVTGIFPASEFGVVELSHGSGAVIDLVELLSMGSLDSFDRAVEFRASWRKDKESEGSFFGSRSQSLGKSLSCHRSRGLESQMASFGPR
jgi:hypothetical protein